MGGIELKDRSEEVRAEIAVKRRTKLRMTRKMNGGGGRPPKGKVELLMKSKRWIRILKLQKHATHI